MYICRCIALDDTWFFLLLFGIRIFEGLNNMIKKTQPTRYFLFFNFDFFSIWNGISYKYPAYKIKGSIE